MRKLCFFLCLLTFLPVFAVQDSIPEGALVEREKLVPMDFDEKQIEELKENPDFDYSEEIEEDNWWTRFKRYVKQKWNSFLNWLFGDYTPPLLIRIFLDILPYLLLGLLLGLFLYLVARLNPAAYVMAAPGIGEVIYNEEEQIIKTQDIKKLIGEAVAMQDYRLAVRYHFLYVLQQLSRKDIVSYDPSRTDEEYLLELQQEDLKSGFRRVSRIYDFIWYGNFETSPGNYEKIRRDFEKMEALIETGDEQKV